MNVILAVISTLSICCFITNAANTPAPTNVPLRKIVGVVVGTTEELNFKNLFPNQPPMTIVIGDVSPTVRVLKADGSDLDESRTAQKNIFLLEAPSKMPPSPLPPVRVNKTENNNNKVTDFMSMWRDVAPATASIKFTMGIDGEDEQQGELVVRIHPYVFVAISYKFRSIASSSGTPRLVQLGVRNPIERMSVNFDNPGRLGAVTIVSVPSNGCKLTQFDGAAIEVAGMNVTDNQLRVYISPPENGLALGAQCAFTYAAVTTTGFASNIATVTLTGSPPEKVTTYNTNVYFRPKEDTTRPIEFFANTINPPSNFTWIITQGPVYGELFDVEESSFTQLTAPLPLTGKSLPYTVYSGPENRIVLFYRLNKKGIETFLKPTPTKLERGNTKKQPATTLKPRSASSQAVGDPITPLSDSITYTVKDAYTSSEVATVKVNFVADPSPICGPSNFPHTFWDKPLNNILMNYTIPSGRRASRIILTNIPTNPIGELFYKRTFASEDYNDDYYYEEDLTAVDEENIVNAVTKALKVGDMFDDRNRRLSYMVKPENRYRYGEDVFTFRVVTDTSGSLSCHGTLRFTVVPHDARDKKIAVRNEIARLGSYELMPFWGLANQTLLNNNKNDPASIAKIRITKAPVLGKIFGLSESTPFLPGEMIRGHVGMMAYCGQVACDQYAGKELVVGSEQTPLELWSAQTLDSLQSALYYFYKSPHPEGVPNDYKKVSDSFEYVFVDKNGKESEVQKVIIYFRKPRRRIVTLEYSSDQVQRWENFNRQQETIIPVQVADPALFAVEILNTDMYRRHGEKVPYRLLQYREEGNRIVPGNRLPMTLRSGLTANWILNPNNTIVLIPTIESRVQRYQFRARLYPKKTKGAVEGDDIADITDYEEVRVIVQRSDNTVPRWDPTNEVKYNVFVDERIEFMLAATDDEDDLLSFVIGEAPTKGTLEAETTLFGVTTTKTLKAGSRVIIPKGSALRSEVVLQYSSRGSNSWTDYPVRDYFTVYADDGGGVLSAPLRIDISIVGDRTARNSQPLQFIVHTGNIKLYAVGLFIVLLGMIAYFLRRHYARRAYGGVPTVDVEMS